MENFKIVPYVGIIAVVQFLATLGFGYYTENRDFNAALVYPLVYLLPAIFINYMYGFLLQLFTPKQHASGFWLLWLVAGTGLLLVNELFNKGATQMVHIIILSAALLNAVYFYKDLTRKKPALTKPS